MNPKVFIGSSVENRKIANAIRRNYEHDPINAVVWTHGIFELQKPTLDSLLKGLQEYDFGIFVFTPDDMTRIRGKQYSSTRDNVLFEFGLFIGKLGKERTFFVIPRGVKNIHLATDLLGLTPADYDPSLLNNPRDALFDACERIKEEIEKLGPVPREQELAAEDLLTKELFAALTRIKTPRFRREQLKNSQFWNFDDASIKKWIKGRINALKTRSKSAKPFSKELRIICYSFRSYAINHGEAIEGFLDNGGRLKVLMVDYESEGFFEKTALESARRAKKLQDWRDITKRTRKAHQGDVSTSLERLQIWKEVYGDRVGVRFYSDTPNISGVLFGNEAMSLISYFLAPTSEGSNLPTLLIDNLASSRTDPNLQVLQQIISNWFEIKFANGKRREGI